MSRGTMHRLLAEFKRRHVFRVIAVYGAVAFVVLQVADIAFPGLGLPDWSLRLVLVLLLLGLPIAIVLAWAFEVTPDGVQRTASATPEELDAIVEEPAATRWPIGIAAVIAVVVLAAGAWWTLRDRGDPGDRRYDSIAVLPFENLSGDEQDEYLGDGLAEELLNALVRVEGLKVASRTSAFAFKNSAADIRTIADSLNVETVLEGSVRRSANEIRITAQLIAGEDGFHLWSEIYERPPGDLLAIQDDLTREIVERLAVELGRDTELAAEVRGTQDVVAYDYYLQGRHFWNKRRGADMEIAISLFHKAIAEDSSYAPAYSAIAETYAVPTGWGDDPRAALDSAEHYARRAIEFDPTHAPAHTALAYAILTRDLDFVGSEPSFTRALELDPTYATAYQWHAELLAATGRREEAVRQARRAVELDPTMIIRWSLSRVLIFAGRYDEAIEVLDALENDHGDEARGRILGNRARVSIRSGDPEQLMSLIATTAPPDVVERVKRRVSAAGAVDDGRAPWRVVASLVDSMSAEVPELPADAVERETLDLWMVAEPDTVLTRLMRLSEDPEDVGNRYAWFEVLADSHFDPLRSDPRFAEINERFGVRGARLDLPEN